MERILMAASAGFILALGLVHLLYTFRGPKLTPRDPALRESMMRVARSTATTLGAITESRA